MQKKEESKSWGRLLEHRQLLVRFTRRYIERQTKGSWLGLFWVLLNPLLMLGLYSVVFGVIMGSSFGVAEDPGPYDFPLGIFIGLTVLGLVTETMGQSSNLILASENLVKKVVFPIHLPVPLFPYGRAWSAGAVFPPYPVSDGTVCPRLVVAVVGPWRVFP
jgi:lipopolysaccharide transport system permease protein